MLVVTGVALDADEMVDVADGCLGVVDETVNAADGCLALADKMVDAADSGRARRVEDDDVGNVKEDGVANGKVDSERAGCCIGVVDALSASLNRP